MREEITFKSLPNEWMTLFRNFSEYQYGRMEDLHIRNGKPTFDPPPLIFRDHKLSNPLLVRSEKSFRGSSLKNEHIHLMQDAERLQDTVFELIVFKGGLPFLVTTKEGMVM